jgi:hypothetical protein
MNKKEMVYGSILKQQLPYRKHPYILANLFKYAVYSWECAAE